MQQQQPGPPQQQHNTPLPARRGCILGERQLQLQLAKASINRGLGHQQQQQVPLWWHPGVSPWWQRRPAWITWTW